jgi:NitT/TauT family transport system ATP-binding protein
MDEPFSSLDNFTREEAQDFFLSVKQERRLTIVMVSHSIEEAVYLADTVYVMSGRNPGTIRHSLSIVRDGESHSRFRENPRFHGYCTSLRKLLRGPAP